MATRTRVQIEAAGFQEVYAGSRFFVFERNSGDQALLWDSVSERVYRNGYISASNEQLWIAVIELAGAVRELTSQTISVADRQRIRAQMVEVASALMEGDI